MTTKHVNHLANEKSPYLLQHVHNPIDWYPWGEEAFAKAKEEDKPIFFSCGYSTCHWCHVMEKESFEDEEVAELLNRNFVAIKVDREERPDIDHIYMAVCQAMTGSGGWPLTVVMTPDRQPFFAGTYFPRTSKWGRLGLMEILTQLNDAWLKDRDKVVQYAGEIIQMLQERKAATAPGTPSPEILDVCYRQLAETFDPEYGGFGPAPKFPTPHNLMFLMRYWRRTGEAKALSMVETTLDSLRRGGIYDHIGGGFARYSTDKQWLVPHFEKMSYDNAMLAYTFLEAYQSTNNPEFSRIAEETLAYVMRDMTDPGGGFYSAEDADSEGVEGKFYVWRKTEIIAALGEQEGAIFNEVYGVTEAGNFEQANILNLIRRDIKETASRHNISVDQLNELLARGRKKLFKIRKTRVHPFKDDKILTGWNGLMIAAMAKAARILAKPEYARAAEKAVDFILTRMVRADGRLLARYRAGEAAFPAYLDDYAFLVWGLTELFETTQKVEFLRLAITFTREMIKYFTDEDQGGFYFYGSDTEQLVARPKEVYDGAIPSGNSAAAYVLLRLARLTEEEKLAAIGERVLEAFLGDVQKYPRAYCFFLTAVDTFLTAPRHIVIAGRKNDPETRLMLEEANRLFAPETLVLLNDQETGNETAEIIPLVNGKDKLNNKTAAYICENFACQRPIQGFDEFKQTIASYKLKI